MARIRTIKPEFAGDEKMATVCRNTRLTFLLMVSQADDEGYLAAAPRQLLGTLYPLDESASQETLEMWLDGLVEIGRIRWRRTRDGARVIELVNWSKHQRIDKPTPSKIKPLLMPLAESSRGVREPPANVQRIEREVGRGVGSGVVDLPEGEASPHSRVDNRSAPPAAHAAGNSNIHSGTAPLPHQAKKLLRTCYGTAPERRQADVHRQLLESLGKGALFEKGERVKAVDVDHLDDTCRRVLADPPRKSDAAIRLVLIKLRDTFGEVRAAREKTQHPAEPPRQRSTSSGPVRIGDAMRTAG